MNARIDWQRVCLNLRTHYKPLVRVADEIGCDEATLQRLARGETPETKWSICTQLLDLHLDKCPELHRADLILSPQQGELL